MNKVLTIICVIYFLFVPWRLMAAELSPSATVSLLIASPDTVILCSVSTIRNPELIMCLIMELSISRCQDFRQCGAF